jgi:metallophosphoesterase (TIGR00282 family)
LRVLFLGDVVGRVGRRGVAEHLPGLRQRLGVEFVVCNAENAAGGFGLTESTCAELFASGVDVITTGNHVWDKREIIELMDQDDRILRPANFPAGTPGKGFALYESDGGRRVLVINVMLRLFMDPLDDPFAAVERVLEDSPLGYAADFTLIDMHGEASSEKMAMGHAADGRASLVVGTHTHVPTADTMILAAGTAYQTDAGMCGDYDSVIGMKKEAPVQRFTTKMPTARLEAAEGEATVCGVFVETDDKTGLAVRAEPVRIGGLLIATEPAG